MCVSGFVLKRLLKDVLSQLLPTTTHAIYFSVFCRFEGYFPRPLFFGIWVEEQDIGARRERHIRIHIYFWTIVNFDCMFILRRNVKENLSYYSAFFHSFSSTSHPLPPKSFCLGPHDYQYIIHVKFSSNALPRKNGKQ